MLGLHIVLYFIPLYVQVYIVHYNIYLDVEFTHCTVLYPSLCTSNVVQYNIYLDVEFTHCTVLYPSLCTSIHSTIQYIFRC